MTLPASKRCGFCICYNSFFIHPQVKQQSENVHSFLPFAVAATDPEATGGPFLPRK